MKSLLVVLGITLFIFQGCTQEKVTLNDLTVPLDVLPDGCELAPGVGLPFGPANKSNPVMTKDSLAILGLCFFMIAMPVPGDEPSVQPERVQEWVGEQAAKIETAYLAGYYDKSRKENMVWALQFKDPKEAQNHFKRLRKLNQIDKNKHYFIMDSILIYAWTDNLSDHSCFDAIIGYLEKKIN